MYKAVELVFSLIFAFETRKVKVKELNDSKIIVFCVYTIVISAIAFIPTTLLLQNQPTAQYAVTGIVCLLTATVLLAIIYVPKVTIYVHTLLTGIDVTRKLISSMSSCTVGITTTCKEVSYWF